MKFVAIALLMTFPLGVFSQTTPIQAGTYSWKTPVTNTAKNIRRTLLFEGSGHDMEYVSMSACEIEPSKKRTALQVPADEEHMIIIKSGTVQVAFNDSSWSLTPGSIALLMPQQKFSLRNPSADDGQYYLMKYRSKTSADHARGKASGGSIVREWNKLAFRSHDRGGVRPYFQRPTTMCRRFEMHVTTLNAGLKSHDPHTHRAEEIILILDDTGDSQANTEMLIGDKNFQGKAGDMYYVPSNLLHGITNKGDSTCSYFAYQFE